MAGAKKGGNKMNLKKIVMVGLGTYSLYAFAIAPRKVTIPALVSNSSGSTSQGVELLNGSANPVTYKVTCYDKAGTSVFGPTNHTLISKQKAVHGATPHCSDGKAGITGKFEGGMLGCGSYQNNFFYSPESHLCPADFHHCTFSELQVNSGLDHSKTTAWVASGFTFSVTGDWSVGYSSNSSMSYINYSSHFGYIPGPVADSNSVCYSGSNGGGTSQSHCGVQYNYNTTLCCPNSGAERTAHSCDIEVVDPTTSGGFLQSPQFKGSSPF